LPSLKEGIFIARGERRLASDARVKRASRESALFDVDRRGSIFVNHLVVDRSIQIDSNPSIRRID
jgi:hypothetical protein